MGNTNSAPCSSCKVQPLDDTKVENDLDAYYEGILEEELPALAAATPPSRVTLRDDEIQKIMDVWTKKQKEREDRDDTMFSPERQFSIALLMNDESLAKRLLHHISDEEILRKLYNDPLSKTEVRHVIIDRAREIASKRFGLSHSFVGHRVRAQGDRYKLQEVIVGFSAWTLETQSKKVMGIDVEVRNYRYVNNEAEKVEKVRRDAKDELTDAECELLRSCIRKYSSRLWRRHSNLNIISACSIKSKKNGTVMKRQPCIVLYCSVKGIIPFLEKPFPKLLKGTEGNDVPVDVREGYFQFAGSTIETGSQRTTSATETEIVEPKTYPVCIGEQFKTRALNREGTIGPFVELPWNKTGFITCAHSVFDCSRQSDFQYPQEKVLPNDVSISVFTDVNGESVERELLCKVMHASFTTRSEDKTMSKRDISLDAAVVELPESLRPECELKMINEAQPLFCGYEDSDYVEFRTGEIVKKMNDNYRCLSVVKCGSATGLTSGALKMNGVQVKHSDFKFTSNGKPWTLDSHVQVLQGQYEISSRSEGTFIGHGDSGASFYVKGRFGELYCIGIAIGFTSYGSAIVTPILPILKKFDLNQRYLKKFPEESSEDDSDEEEDGENNSRSSQVGKKSKTSDRNSGSNTPASVQKSKSIASTDKSKSPLPRRNSKRPGTSPEKNSDDKAGIKVFIGAKVPKVVPDGVRSKSLEQIARPQTTPIGTRSRSEENNARGSRGEKETTAALSKSAWKSQGSEDSGQPFIHKNLSRSHSVETIIRPKTTANITRLRQSNKIPLSSDSPGSPAKVKHKGKSPSTKSDDTSKSTEINVQTKPSIRAENTSKSEKDILQVKQITESENSLKSEKNNSEVKKSTTTRKISKTEKTNLETKPPIPPSPYFSSKVAAPRDATLRPKTPGKGKQRRPSKPSTASISKVDLSRVKTPEKRKRNTSSPSDGSSKFYETPSQVFKASGSGPPSSSRGSLSGKQKQEIVRIPTESSFGDQVSDDSELSKGSKPGKDTSAEEKVSVDSAVGRSILDNEIVSEGSTSGKKIPDSEEGSLASKAENSSETTVHSRKARHRVQFEDDSK